MLFTVPYKNWIKGVYYRFRPETLIPQTSLKLGYVFHTEKIYDTGIFQRLLDFCLRYKECTGKQPICTIMPPTNARVKHAMAALGIAPAEYLHRVRELARLSTIGYHGHFWKDPKRHLHRDEEMRGDVFEVSAFQKQFDDDLAWFEQNGVSHHGIYAGGWWMMHLEVQRALLENGFKLDFSFSYSPWFRNPYSLQFMTKNEIKPGQPFSIERDGMKMLCVQNLIGCHHTPFPMDFIRNLNNLLDGVSAIEVAGVVNAHDFDLHPEFTLRCLSYLKAQSETEFWGVEDFLKITAKVVSLPVIQ